MGITLTAPPIARLVSFFAHRETLCTFCRKAPKLDGERYCSQACASIDAEMQAHG